MSLEAINWANRVEGITPTENSVLRALAHYHNRHTGQCNPKKSVIASDTKLGIATVHRAIDSLVEKSLITSTATRGRGKSNEYVLQMHLLMPRKRLSAGHFVEPENVSPASNNVSPASNNVSRSREGIRRNLRNSIEQDQTDRDMTDDEVVANSWLYDAPSDPPTDAVSPSSCLRGLPSPRDHTPAVDDPGSGSHRIREVVIPYAV